VQRNTDSVARHLFLIGYRATGKTEVARVLGRRLGRTVIDLDAEISRKARRSIVEIFEQQGEIVFRRFETDLLTGISDREPAVVSLGGGSVKAEENQTFLRENGNVVWLKARPDSILARMGEDPGNKFNRPALTRHSSIREIEVLIEERSPIYAACADYTIETDDLSVDQVSEQIVKWWQAVDIK